MRIISNYSGVAAWGPNKGEKVSDHLLHLIQNQANDNVGIELDIAKTRTAIVCFIELLFKKGLINQSDLEEYLHKLGYYNIKIESIIL